MASVDTVLVSLIANEPSLATTIASRLTPDVIPQGATLPAAAYQRISTASDSDLDGTNDLATTRFQLTIWANSVAQRDAIRRLLIAMIRQYNLQWRLGTRPRWYDNVRIGGILVDNVINDHEQNSNVYQLLVDLLVMANEV